MNMPERSWKHRACRYVEISVVVLIVAAVWLLMFLPVAIYYLVGASLKS